MLLHAAVEASLRRSKGEEAVGGRERVRARIVQHLDGWGCRVRGWLLDHKVGVVWLEIIDCDETERQLASPGL